MQTMIRVNVIRISRKLITVARAVVIVVLPSFVFTVGDDILYVVVVLVVVAIGDCNRLLVVVVVFSQ